MASAEPHRRVPTVSHGSEKAVLFNPPVFSGPQGAGRSPFCKKSFHDPVCCTTMRFWWRLKFSQLEWFINRHHWKVLGSFLLLALSFLGLRLMKVDIDFEKLWIEKSDRLVSEWSYLDSALQQGAAQGMYSESQYSFGSDARRSRMMMMLLSQSQSAELSAPSHSAGSAGAHKFGASSTGLPGHEFMGTMESIFQTTLSSRYLTETMSDEPSAVKSVDTVSNQNMSQLLTPRALLDHVDFMVKVRRLQITVGSSKWSFKDLCQRATLPFGAEMHHIQAYLDMLIPCMVITPLDCFWEGAKVLGPEETMWVPWFNERTLVQWTNIDPVGLLEDLRTRYGNYSRAEVTKLIELFRAAGIDHGYLNRTCLDPNDPACPSSAPNHRNQPPNIPQILSGGCPGFAANLLHWPEELIVGGRVHVSPHSSDSQSFSSSPPNSPINTSAPVLISGNALQSLIMLRSARDLYDAVRHSDPYRHESWTLADAQHVLDEWRRNLRQLVVEHNAGLSSNSEWCFYAFTDNSLRDILRGLTLRFGPVKFVGCVLLVFLYGLICLLDWRDPVQSQCWLVLSGFVVAAFASVAGLGICAAVGLPFNVFTIQVLPFLVMGLSVDSVFALTTCYQCRMARLVPPISRRYNRPPLIPWVSVASVSTLSSSSTSDSSLVSFSPIPLLAEHGPSLLFGAIAIAGAFFSASYIPVPLMQQFCLQAGTLVLVHSVCLLFLLPGLLKIDLVRRSARRMDLLCCLQQPNTESTLVHHGTRMHDTSFEDEHVSHSRTDPCMEYSTTMTTNGTENRRGSFHSETVASSAGACPCSSIQVSVINHVSDGARSNKPSSCISRSSGLSSVSGGHTVHTTVTVSGSTQGLKFSGSPSRTFDSSKQRNYSRSPKLYASNVSSVCGYYNTRHHSHWCRYLTSVDLPQPLLADMECDQPKPLLVRFAYRMALFLTYHWSIQLFICIIGAAPFVLAALLSQYGLRLGLDWSRLIPVDEVEYGFVKHSEQAFGLRYFQIIARGTDLPGDRPIPSRSGLGKAIPSAPTPNLSPTKFMNMRHRIPAVLANVGRGIDFPVRQRQLHQLYTRLSKLPHVMLAGRGYWLEALRDWLQRVQDAFDSDRQRGLISPTGYWSLNASELGVLGLRLIVQTDRGPELSRINTGRLVHAGIVDPPAFYVLLRMWRTHDALNFSSLACVIHPEPSPVQLNYLHSPSSGRPSDLYALPPAEPIEFIQTNYYAVGINTMPAQLELVQNVRLLTEGATVQGVPSFPVGAPFTFSEHYFYLIRETAIAMGIYFAIVFVAALILFASPVIILLLLVVGAGGGFCAALCGMMLLGLELNPISAGLMLFSAGLGARGAAGFLGSWPTPHFACTSRAGLMTGLTASQVAERTTCVCQHARSNKACIANCPLCCASASTSKPINNPNNRSANCLVHSVDSVLVDRASAINSTASSGRCQFLRGHLVATLSNQFAPALHTTMGLVLATVLLVAARVPFIADHFFSLLLVVSFCSLFNAVCLIPAICYLIHPLHQFILPSSLTRQCSTRIRNPNHSRDGKPARFETRRGPLPRTTASKCEVQLERLHHGVSQPPPQPPISTTSLSTSSSHASDQSVSPLETDCTPLRPPQNVESPVTVQITADRPIDLRLSSAPVFRPPFQPPLAKCTHAQLYELCNRRLLELPAMCQQSPGAAAAAAAAVVAAVAAAASSVRSRPASLSTISEEPSHSSSTLSLNCAVPPVITTRSRSPHPSSAACCDTEHTSDCNRVTQTSPLTPSSELTGVFNFDKSTSALYHEIFGSLPSPSALFSDALPASPDGENSQCTLARNLLTLVAFAGRPPETPLRKHSSRRTTERSPPPSYSSVIKRGAPICNTSAHTLPKTHTPHLESPRVDTSPRPLYTSQLNSPSCRPYYAPTLIPKNHSESRPSSTACSVSHLVSSSSIAVRRESHNFTRFPSDIAFRAPGLCPRTQHHPSRLKPLTLSDIEIRTSSPGPQTRDL